MGRRDIVQDGIHPIDAKPCDENGRPLDPIAASWWDGGFRVVGYVVPPDANFTRYIRAVEAGGDKRRHRRMVKNLRAVAEANE